MPVMSSVLATSAMKWSWIKFRITSQVPIPQWSKCSMGFILHLFSCLWRHLCLLHGASADSFLCLCSGHRLLMSGIRPVFAVHIPDIKFQVKLMSGIRTVMSGTRTVMSGIRTMMSGIRKVMSGRWTKYLSLFQTSIFDVWKMDRENCSCPGHQSLMSGTWTENTVHVPDINFWCPEYGQLKLSIFQTSNIFQTSIFGI